MISPRKLFTNRANARRSTGPRTPEGKARVARNARRHGLRVSPLRDPRLSNEIEMLARAIEGREAPGRRREVARRIAAAQVDLLRARRARLELLAAKPRDGELVARLAGLDRYERRAISQRKRAIRYFDDTEIIEDSSVGFVRPK